MLSSHPSLSPSLPFCFFYVWPLAFPLGREVDETDAPGSRGPVVVSESVWYVVGVKDWFSTSLSTGSTRISDPLPFKQQVVRCRSSTVRGSGSVTTDPVEGCKRWLGLKFSIESPWRRSFNGSDRTRPSEAVPVCHKVE